MHIARRLNARKYACHAVMGIIKQELVTIKDFGGWAMLVMVEFSTGGCWEVTGQYKGQAASFVVQVEP
jgi:hypothetical protein